MMSDELKVGDWVCVDKRFGAGVDLMQIVRETKTTFVTRYGTKIRKSDLSIIGPDRFGPFYVRTPTDADMMSWRIEMAKMALGRLAVTESNIDAVESLIESSK